ncbi:MAG: hypothetical protein COA78_15735 [Blastopirellula sp.]|nr:MAG: hypothetical protein COA78_15735 [Blastopirellula sp.]
MVPKDDIYIHILEAAFKEDHKFKLRKLFEEVKFDEDQEFLILLSVDQGNLFGKDPSGFKARYDKGYDDDVWLTVEDRFRLLEYVELKEARESSRNATYFAGAALILSFVSTMYSICFS